MVGVSRPGPAHPCRGHVCPPPPVKAPHPVEPVDASCPTPPLHQPPRASPKPRPPRPHHSPQRAATSPSPGRRGKQSFRKVGSGGGRPRKLPRALQHPVVGFWFGAVGGGRICAHSCQGRVLAPSGCPSPLCAPLPSWPPLPPPCCPARPPLKSPLTPAPRDSFPCSFGWTACPSPPSAGLPAWLGPRPQSVARPDPALIGPVGSEGPRWSPELPFLRVGGSLAPEEGLEVQGLTPAPAGQPQRGWYFLPPPPPSQAVWQRPERSWWGFPRFLLGVPGWGGGAGGSWWAFWREPVRFRTVGGGWGGGRECPFPLSEGPQGPPGWPLLSGGCSFCLHTAATGNSLSRSSLCPCQLPWEHSLF